MTVLEGKVVLFRCWVTRDNWHSTAIFWTVKIRVTATVSNSTPNNPIPDSGAGMKQSTLSTPSYFYKHTADGEGVGRETDRQTCCLVHQVNQRAMSKIWTRDFLVPRSPWITLLQPPLIWDDAWLPKWRLNNWFLRRSFTTLSQFHAM